MRIDAHQHYWRYRAADFPWIDDEMAQLRQDFLPHDLTPLLARRDVDGAITVQARQSLDETAQLLRWAESRGKADAVVGWVDITAADLARQLETLCHPRLCGFRHLVQDERDPARWLHQPAVAAGMSELQRRGYVWDMLVTWRHLSALTTFAARHDQHWLVLDHLGKPDIARGAKAWGEQVAELAAMPHVVCKLSGLVTEAPEGQWSAAQLRPFIEEALVRFGPQRLMFGSDWPVCLMAADYDEVSQLLEGAINTLSADEQAQIWGTTAASVYGLTGGESGSVFKR